MALSLNIGAGSIAAIQKSALFTRFSAFGPGAVGSASLPAPSTAGSTLIAVIGNVSTNGGYVVTVMPAGWSLLAQGIEATGSDLEIWAYVANPGGISSISFTLGGGSGLGSVWNAHMSEWTNVTSASSLEASGTANAISGTTLAPTTSSNVLTTGDLAISAWIQGIASLTTATFTTPGGWARLADNGSDSQQDHTDIEYQLNPATGGTLGPTLTSNRTSGTAAGAIVVLKPVPPPVDQSAYLDYASLNLKLNQLDFNLIDCPTPIQVTSGVTLSSPSEYPDWVGTVSEVRAVNRTNLSDGHQVQIISATNTQSPNFTSAPYNLTDNPATNTEVVWGLENGDTWGLENGAAEWGVESSVQEDTYFNLSVRSQVGATVPSTTLTTIGYVTVYRPGMWPGMTFKLTSANLASWITAPGSLYTIQSITVTYRGAPPVPFYELQFGDLILTLAEWTANP